MRFSNLFRTRMERSFGFIQFVSIFLLMSIVLIGGSDMDIKTRASSSHEDIEESEMDNKPIDAPRLSSWFSLQSSVSDDFLNDPLRTVLTKGINKRKPLVHPSSGERIRLRSKGKFSHSGLVELYREGKWGYVCDDGWDLSDANVACKELGFTMGAISATATHGTLPDSQRFSTSILINDMQCFGTETSLQECTHSLLSDCSQEQVAGIDCQKEAGCPKNWILGFDKCYKFYTKAKTIEQASRICARDNASLVTIDSDKENHFLSNMLKHSVSYIHQWHTAGRKTKEIWQWKKAVVENNERQKLGNRTEDIQPVFTELPSAVNFYKWFPGWPSHNNEQAEPTVKNRYNCLTLSDTYNDPVTESLVVVDYFYWKADKCRTNESINFICQMTNSEKEDVNMKVTDCYTQDGSSYRGTAAITEGGKECLKWSSSLEINDKRYPGKGLGDHNFCRNPDGDTKPWCWVDHDQGTFAICKLPQCSQVDNATESSKAIPDNARVQLVGGRDDSEGNVEVVIDNVQYRVCDDNWDNKEASVICRMLGYRHGGIATKNSLFGPDVVSIILDDVDCNGTEPNLSMCSATAGDKKSNCSSGEYAGAICAKTPRVTNFLAIEGHEHKSTGICGRRPFDYNNTVKSPDQQRSLAVYSEAPQYLPGFQEARIIGGKFVQHGAYPWQVRLHLVLNAKFEGDISTGLHHCGAVIISEFWLLTAAHCIMLKEKRVDELVIVVGDHSLKVKDFGEQIFAIQETISHDNYADDTKDYDIGLIKIKPTSDGRGIKFNSYAQPACLPDPKTPYSGGTKCLVAGWGYLNPRQPGDDSAYSIGYPTILKAIEVPVLAEKVCEQLYTKFNPGFSSQRMFCAGYVKGGIDSCDGDSGGPLICKIAGAYTVLGITSWGRGCAMPNMPGVYVRVSHFLPWIQQKVQLHSKNNAEKALPRKH